MLELNQIYNGDCLELMKELPDKSIDLVLTDPPYGIQINKMSFTLTGNKKASINSKAKSTDYRGMAEWDNIKLTKDYFDEMFRVSKNQIIFGGNYYTDILPVTRSWLIWDKKCEDKYRNDFADCELMWSSQGVARIFRWLWHGMLQQDMKNKDKRVHPTQKPVGLIKQLIEKYSKENDLIFDPFLGSGTTAVAAKQLNRNFIGIELSKEYCTIAYNRIKLLDTNK